MPPKPKLSAVADAQEPPMPDESAEILRLSCLNPSAYDREREKSAKLLGMRVGTLDKLVDGKRKEDEPESGQGRAIELPEPEPWPEPVDGAELLADIAAQVRRYMVMEQGAPEAIALWVLHAHAFDAFGISPRLAITSPRPGCGKTTLLDIIGPLVTRPLQLANITPAAVFRTIEMARPTLLIDEADTFLTNNDELRGVLNSGHRRGGNVVRIVGEDLEPRQFSTWAPAAIAMIGNLPGTLADRSIPIVLKRKRPDERVERFRFDQTEDLDRLARMAARWTADNLPRIRALDATVPGNLDNRAADNWRPLLAIAELAGGSWSEMARKIAASTVDANQSKRTELLSDIRDVFADKCTDRISSADLVEALVGMEGRPWAEHRNGRPLTVNTLARMLAPDGVSPSTIRWGATTAKGYSREQFDDAFGRYLPIPPNQSVTTSQPAENLGLQPKTQPSQPESCYGSNKGQNPSVSAGCDGVTVESTPIDAEEAEWTA